MSNTVGPSQRNLDDPSAERVQRYPPGPPPSMFIKNMFHLLYDRLGFLLKMREKYGDVVRIPTFLGPLYLISHPRDVRRILQENHRNYNRDTFEFRMLSLVVGKTLLTTDGPSWLAQRRMLQPAFHHRKITALGQLMSETACYRLEDWEARGIIDSGKPFDIAKEINNLTLEITVKALFDTDVNGDILRASQTFTTVQRLAVGAVMLPFLLSLPTPYRHRFRKACSELNEMVDAIIRNRRQRPGERADVLEMILQARDETGRGMDDQQARQEILTILLASYETTANGLIWTIMLLAQHPQAQEQVRAELRHVLGQRPPTTEDLPRLPALRSIFDEALRLYPPAWLFSRRAIDADELGSYVLPKGASVVLCPYVTHHHPDFWVHPEIFDPERFLPEHSGSRVPFAYFPFGGGPHLCIGNQFALMAAQLFLATFLSRYQPRLVTGKKIVPEALFALHPRGGLPIALHRVQ